MLACSQFLEQSLERGEGFIPANVAADLKRGRTFTKRAMDEWLSEIDTKTAKGVVNMIKDYEISIQTNRQAANDPGKKMQAALNSGMEYIERFAEQAMAGNCANCDGACRDECPLYEGFVHFGIPTYDENHVNCPYAMRDAG